MGHSRLTQNIHDRRILWLAILLLAVLVFAGLWLTLSQFGPEGENNPLAIISWWVSKSADYQMHLTQKASGWVQKMFRLTPEWMHMPLLIGYGVARPFLPAALVVDSQSAIWPWIELWRSIGWTILLAFLAYAPLRLLTKRDATRFVQALVFIVWAVILVASFRSGGDQADNPRYRAAFASLQIGLAAWVWVAQERSADVWLRRALASLGFVLAWFLPWYLRREIPEIWPISDVFKTFALGIVSAALFAIWDWARGSPGSQSEKLNG